MKNIMKKSIAVVLCLAFSGMQMSFATVLTRGVDSFNNVQVLGGTGAIIKNTSAGLKQIETDQTNATLRFDNHTKIDWSKFNVDNGQKLYFNNGTYGVLNVVTQGSISKIAGTIQSDTGRVIISNPNGILFNGGTFTSAGSVVLTTKDLTGLSDSINYNTYDIGTSTGAASGANVGIVAVIGGSTISAPDINILANGVHFDASTLSSPSTNGVVLVTADGANYAATTIEGTTIKTNVQPLYMANSSVQTQDGTITFSTGASAKVIGSNLEGDFTGKGAKVANKSFIIDSTTIDGNAEIKDTDYIQVINNSHVKGNLTTRDNKDNAKDTYGTFITSSTIDGNLDVHGVDNVRLTSVTSGKTTVDANGGYIQVNGGNMGVIGESNSLNAHNSYVAIYKGATFNGDTDVKGSQISFGYYETDGTIVQGTTTVNGDLTAIIDGTIGFSDIVRANNITLTTNKSSILNAHSANGNGTLIAMDANGVRGDITLSAPLGAITSLSGDKVVNPDNSVSSSPYFEMMFEKDIDFVDLDALAGYKVDTNVDLFGRNATLDSKGRNSIRADLTGDLSIEAGANANVMGTIGGNIRIVAGTTAKLDGASIEGNADLSGDMIQVLNGTRIKGNATLKDVKDNSNDTYGIYVTDSRIDGNLVARGKDVGSTPTESPDNVRILNSTVDGTVTATANGNIQLLGSTVGKATLTNANQQNYVRVDNSTVNGDLDIVQADSIIFGTYAKNSLLSPGSVTVNGDINANAIYTIGYSSDVTANAMTFTTTSSSVVQANSDAVSGSLTANSITVNAPVGAVVGLNGSADSGVSEFYTAMQGSYIPGTKGAADHSALTIKSLNSGADDLVVNLNTKVSNLDTTAANTTVNVTSAGGQMQDLKVTASNNVDVQNVKAVKAAADTENTSGNVVVISTNGNAKIGNVVGDTDVKVYAANGEIEVTGKLVADNEDNGVGELNITGKKAYNSGVTDLTLGSANAGGANIIVNIEEGSITASGLTTDRHAADDNSGNFILSTGSGNITVGDVIADTDLKVYTGNGDISVTGVLMADNEDNGIGELNIKGNTAKNAGMGDLTLNSTNAGGANIIVDIKSGDITASGLTTDRHAAGDTSGNFILSTDNGNITAGDIIADTNLKVLAENGNVVVTGQLKADNEANGVGDLVIKGQTAKNLGSSDLTMNGTDFGGANIEVTIDDGNIIASGLTASQQGRTDDLAGNVNLTTGSGNISVGDIIADTDLKVIAQNGTIDVTGKLLADNDGNRVGDLVLRADTADLVLDNSTGVNFTGTNIEAVINKGDITANGLNAAGNDDNNGNITISTGEGNVIVANTSATHDITITAQKGSDDNKGFATVTSTYADFDGNGQGSLTVNADNKAVVTGGSGANVAITSNNGDVEASTIITTAPNDDNNGNVIITANNGDVTVDYARGDHDVIITAGGDAVVTDAHADTDNNKAGDLIITAGGSATVGDANTVYDIIGNNVIINADDDIVANNIFGKDDVTIISQNGGVDGTNLFADGDFDDIGDLIVKGNNDVIVDGGHGADIEIVSDNGNITANDLVADGDDKNGAAGGQGNIIITADNGNVDVNGADATQDIIITAGHNADVDDAHADTDNNKHGDLIINAGGNANVDDGTGNNVHIDADGDITANDIEGKDDVIINAGGGVTGSDLVADGDNDGIGDLIINGNPINISGNNTGVHVFINGVEPGYNQELTQELLKNFMNLVQSGVDSQLAQSFTPIAFAAEDDDEQSAIAKRIAKTVFKTPETGVVTITEKYKSVK